MSAAVWSGLLYSSYWNCGDSVNLLHTAASAFLFFQVRRSRMHAMCHKGSTFLSSCAIYFHLYHNHLSVLCCHELLQHYTLTLEKTESKSHNSLLNEIYFTCKAPLNPYVSIVLWAACWPGTTKDEAIWQMASCHPVYMCQLGTMTLLLEFHFYIIMCFQFFIKGYISSDIVEFDSLNHKLASNSLGLV